MIRTAVIAAIVSAPAVVALAVLFTLARTIGFTFGG